MQLQLHHCIPLTLLVPGPDLADGGWEPKPVGEGGALMKRRGSGKSRGSAGGLTRSRGTKHSTGAQRSGVGCVGTGVHSKRCRR